MIFKMVESRGSPEYYIPQQDYMTLNSMKLLQHMTLPEFQKKLNKQATTISEKALFTKCLQFQEKSAQSKILSQEIRELRAQINLKIAQQAQDTQKQYKSTNYLKRQEIEKKKLAIVQKKLNIQQIKDKFVGERSTQMQEYQGIFRAFSNKLDKDIATDNENQ